MFNNINKLQKTITAISSLLNISQEPSIAIPKIFTELNNIFGCQRIYIYFLNPNGMNLRYNFGLSEIEEKQLTQNKELNQKTQQFIANKQTIIESSSDKASSIVSGCGINLKGEKSFIISPLKIRSAVFGLLIIEKEGKNAFAQTDYNIAEPFSSVISYVIKDSELSDVFRMQLKILQENIVEKTEAQRVIEDQNRKILEASKIKDDFLANISHELRTPLSAIIGFSDALREQIFGDLNEKQMDYIREINSGAVHLLGLLNGILDMSKIESNQMPLNYSNFSVKQAVDEVANVVRTLAEKKNITVEKNYPEEDVKIYADFKKFQQIMYNLLSNAIKYNDKNGKVIVSVAFDGKKLKVSVRDTGIGIEPKYHKKIFGKFQQIHNIYTKTESSTGLGLTITKEFVEMHKGKIWVESKLDEGTNFIFEIPAI